MSPAEWALQTLVLSPRRIVCLHQMIVWLHSLPPQISSGTLESHLDSNKRQSNQRVVVTYFVTLRSRLARESLLPPFPLEERKDTKCAALQSAG